MQFEARTILQLKCIRIHCRSKIVKQRRNAPTVKFLSDFYFYILLLITKRKNSGQVFKSNWSIKFKNCKRASQIPLTKLVTLQLLLKNKFHYQFLNYFFQKNRHLSPKRSAQAISVYRFWDMWKLQHFFRRSPLFFHH